MGMIKCKFHGLLGIRLVCKHIAQSIRERQNFENPICVTLINNENLDPFETMEGDFYYCIECAKNNNLPLSSCEPPESNFELIASIASKAVCPKCFEELQS